MRIILIFAELAERSPPNASQRRTPGKMSNSMKFPLSRFPSLWLRQCHVHLATPSSLLMLLASAWLAHEGLCAPDERLPESDQ